MLPRKDRQKLAQEYLSQVSYCISKVYRLKIVKKSKLSNQTATRMTIFMNQKRE